MAHDAQESGTTPPGAQELRSSPDDRVAAHVGQRVLALLEIPVVSAVAINAGAPDASVAAMLILILHRRSVLEQALRPVGSWRTGLRMIVVLTTAIWLLIIPFGALLDALGLPRPDLSLFAERIEGNAPALAFTLVWVWTVVAFGEEILGRVFLIDRFQVLFRGLPASTPLAVTAAALLFGLAHSYQGSGGVLLTGILGLVLGVLYVQQKRRIWVNVIVHGAVDTVGMLLLFWGVRFI
jgi:hypothetical protein